MRYLILLLLLSSCTAGWHLQRARQLDPDILTIQADTSYSVNVSYRDTVIYTKKINRVEFVTDTGRIDTLIQTDTIERKFGPVKATSKDSTAHARAWIEKDRLFLETWATVDTTSIIRDTVNTSNKIIDSLQIITKRQEAKIQEKESWIKTTQRWFIIVGVIIFVVAIVLVIWKLT